MQDEIKQKAALVAQWSTPYQIDLFGGKSISLKPADVKRLLNCEKASITEIVLFLKQCQQYGADPFMRDMYIIKYGSKAASTVTGVGFFQKKAQNNPRFEGFLPTEFLSLKAKKWVQCWIPSIHGNNPLGCRVSCHVKGYREKQSFTVNWEENKKDTPIWRSMPSRMLEKVAMVGLLRQTFPADFSGLYIQEEIDGNSTPPEPAEEANYFQDENNKISEDLRVTEGENSFGKTITPEVVQETTPEKEIVIVRQHVDPEHSNEMESSEHLKCATCDKLIPILNFEAHSAKCVQEALEAEAANVAKEMGGTVEASPEVTEVPNYDGGSVMQKQTRDAINPDIDEIPF